MRKVTRTPYGLQVQTALLMGRPHEIAEYTTINEVLTDASLVPYQPTSPLLAMETAEAYDYSTDSQNLRLQYLCIGHGAHFNVSGATGGIPYTDYYAHEAPDAALFKMIPFVVRPVANDLSAEQRTNYRLRKTMQIDGTLYAAYYARKLNFDGVIAETTLTTVVNGVKNTSTFTPTINQLKPTPRQINGTNKGSYISVIAPTQLKFSEQEITWFKEACELLFGSVNYAIISEFAYCTGVDKPVTKRYNATGAATVVKDGVLKEAVGVQISVHVTDYVPLSSADTEYVQAVDVGASEPLMGITV